MSIEPPKHGDEHCHAVAPGDLRATADLSNLGSNGHGRIEQT